MLNKVKLHKPFKIMLLLPHAVMSFTLSSSVILNEHGSEQQYNADLRYQLRAM